MDAERGMLFPDDTMQYIKCIISIMTNFISMYFSINGLCQTCTYSRKTNDVFALRVNFIIVTQHSQIGSTIYALRLYRICVRDNTYTE